MLPRYRVIIDNDFSGDPDDLFALAHHLLSPSVEVRGVIGSHLAPGDGLDPSGRSSENAARIAAELIDLMGLSGQVPVYAGAPTVLPDPTAPLPSAASQAIIAEASREAEPPLFIACGGGLTDLASALMQAPDITERMTLLWIGGPEYPDLAAPPPGSLSVEYNLNIDLNAARYIFNQTRLPIWQVPRNVYRQCIVSLAELEERVLPQGRLGSTLYHSLDRVFELVGRRAETYVLGDQPLVLLTALQTLFEPDAASCDSVLMDTPCIGADGQYQPGSGTHPIRVFTRIDTRLMFEDLFAKLARNHRQQGI